MKLPKLAAALVLLATTPLTAQSPACPTPGPIPADWVEWDKGAYSIWLPERFEYLGSSTFENTTEFWTDGAQALQVNGGGMFGPFTSNAYESVHTCEERSAGSPDIVALLSDSLPGLGAYWDGLYRHPRGNRSGALRLIGTSPSPADRAFFRTVIASVRIHDPPHQVAPPRELLYPEGARIGLDDEEVLRVLGVCWRLDVTGISDDATPWARARIARFPPGVQMRRSSLFGVDHFGIVFELAPLGVPDSTGSWSGVMVPLASGGLWLSPPGGPHNVLGTLAPDGDGFRGTLHAWPGRGPIAGSAEVTLRRMAGTGCPEH